MTLSEQHFRHFLPFKSVAVALIFSAILGPIGLLYSSVTAGVIMMIIGFIVVCSKFIVPIAFVWMISCALSVAATNKYNEKLLQKVTAKKE